MHFLLGPSTLVRSDPHLTTLSYPIPQLQANDQVSLPVPSNNIGFPILRGVVMPELKDAIARIFAATRRARKKCGIFAVSGEQAKIFAEQGFDMISVAADFPVLEMAMQSQMGVARSGAAGRDPGGGLYRYPSGTPGMR